MRKHLHCSSSAARLDRLHWRPTASASTCNRGRGANWLLTEHDRVLLKDIGWGWHTYGWGSGKYFFSGGTREDFRPKAKKDQPRHLVYRVITNFAQGPRPSGLPTEEELLSQSWADLDNERRTIARYSLRKLMLKPADHRLLPEYLDELSEPRVTVRTGAGDPKDYFLLEEAYAAVTRVIERPKSRWCSFLDWFNIQERIERGLGDSIPP
ncbi:hypothetical protein PG997_000650 [Apiospora hydei]|uniref:Uncharacterized protein n=1 Tax=Apiospora hydei TaxID=1337664 RepID=A0ABR1XBA0_9PEZI